MACSQYKNDGLLCSWLGASGWDRWWNPAPPPSPPQIFICLSNWRQHTCGKLDLSKKKMDLPAVNHGVQSRFRTCSKPIMCIMTDILEKQQYKSMCRNATGGQQQWWWLIYVVQIFHVQMCFTNISMQMHEIKPKALNKAASLLTMLSIMSFVQSFTYEKMLSSHHQVNPEHANAKYIWRYIINSIYQPYILFAF